MKFNIFFSIEGPGGKLADIPNNTNPVEAKGVRELLEKLSESLPQPYGCETIGIRIERESSNAP